MKTPFLQGLLSLCLLCIAVTVHSQTQFSCGFDEQRQQWLDADTANYFTMLNYWQRIDKFKNNNYLQAPLDAGPQNSGSSMGAGCARANFVIPIVFHVVYDPGISASNVHDSLVQNQLDILNKAFSGHYGGINTGIQFCLALKKPDGTGFSGINHIADNSPDYRKYGLQRNHLALKAYYDHNRYLNVWIVADIREANNTASLTGGYANIGYTTGIDGVIMRYEAAGNYNYCNSCGFVSTARGFTLVHEVGHWLGLYHTFQGESCLGDDSLTCANGGDHCCDTRAHYNPVNYTTCPPDTQKVCTSANAFYGNTPDPVHNYMNYVPEMCYTNFTADQMAIMYAGLMLTRDRISTPENLLAANLSCCLTTAVFNTTTPFKCTDDTTFTARAYPYSSVRHLWRVYRNGSLVQSHSDTNALFTFLAPDTGTYDVSHAIVYNGNTDTTSFMRVNGFWELAHCGTNLQSTQANWVFGNHAALRFTNQGVFRNQRVYAENPNFNSEDASACISNENGDLLFYGGNLRTPITGGGFIVSSDIWSGKDYKLFANSPVLANDGTPIQGCITFPVPFSQHRYYYILSDGAENLTNLSTRSSGVRYSIIDTTIASTGDIDASHKDISIQAPSTGSEQRGDSNLTVLEMTTTIPKCNGQDYWLFFVDASGITLATCPNTLLCINQPYDNQLKILVYSADSSSISYHSISDSAINIRCAYSSLLKSSPDGNLLAVGDRIFRFNRETGTVAFYKELNIPSSYYVLGSSFSPNSKLYYVYVQHISTGNTLIYQFDLHSSNQNNFYTITVTGGLNYMQLGPDNKLYFSRNGSPQLPVINYPDSVCSPALPNACGFSYEGPRLTNENGVGAVSRISLVNVPDGKKKEDIPLVIYHKDTACFTVHFSSSVCCASSFSWDFGDTNTSLERNPLHTYSAKGTYTIRLIADLDTIYTEVKIGLESFTINGTDTICGTPNYASYSVSLFNPYREYEWTMYKGSGTANNSGNDIDISWDSTGWVKVKANDYRTGCLDSASKNVVVLPTLTNTISSSQQLCNGSATPNELVGSTPTGGTGSSYSYQWYISTDTLNDLAWTLISGATSQNYQPASITQNTFFKRIVHSSKCSKASNIISIEVMKNTISLNSNGGCFEIEGSLPYTSYSGSVDYDWLYSADSSAWGTETTVTTKDWNDIDFHLLFHVKRVMTIGSCSLVSNVVSVLPTFINNLTMATDADTICKQATAYIISANNPVCNTNNWAYQWQKMTSQATGWETISGATSSSLAIPANHDENAHYRRLVTKYDATSISVDSFYLKILAPGYVQTPNSETATEGDSALFWVDVRDLEIIRWIVSKPNSNSEFFEIENTNDTLKIKAESCIDGWSVRPVFSDPPCGGFTAPGIVNINVTPVSYDLWARDYSTDVGGEPSTVSNTFIWDSPDIWNSRSAGITYHQNPEYRVSAPNYIHAIVRNKGASTSIPAKLYLYWTFASTGEMWDRHWLNDTTTTSSIGNWAYYYGNKRPLGGLIGVYNIPEISSGQTWQTEQQWYAPDPGVITGDSNTKFSNLCFLSRIVTCEQRDYGMTYPEIYLMRNNVERNNNIVTKNFIVVDSLAGNGKTHWNGNGNPTDVSATGRLVFTARDCDYFDYGTVLLHLDDELQTLWVGNGANGSGFSIINDSTLQMDSCVMTLDDIAYGAETRSLYGIQFNERDDLIILENVDEYFEFDVQQYLTEESEENSIGGILYGVPVVLSPPEISGSQRRNTPVQDSKANQLAFSAFPNPFNNVLKVVYSLPKDENVTITLSNLLGQTIQTVEQNEFKTAGIHRLDINTVNLTEGIYFITFKAGNEIKQKKIVLIR